MSKSNKARLSVYLGDTATGEKVYLDFDKYPHLIAVGNVGSGKSEALHRIIEELSKNCSPERKSPPSTREQRPFLPSA